MGWIDSLGSIVSASGVPKLIRSWGPLIVMYHGIGGADGVQPADLAQQLDALARRRRVVSLREAAAALGTAEAARLAAITFDDGYRDFAEGAVPLLAARSLHATVFVPAAFVGQWNRWDLGRMERRELMDAALLRQLDPSSVEIGAHGFSHRRMFDLEPGELERETSMARMQLEDLLGRKVDLFAYPYGQRGDFDERAERAVAAAGFIAAASTCFGRGSRPAQRFRLRRVGIEERHSLRDVERRLDGAFDWLGAKEEAAFRLRRLLA